MDTSEYINSEKVLIKLDLGIPHLYIAYRPSSHVRPISTSMCVRVGAGLFCCFLFNLMSSIYTPYEEEEPSSVSWKGFLAINIDPLEIVIFVVYICVQKV